MRFPNPRSVFFASRDTYIHLRFLPLFFFVFSFFLFFRSFFFFFLDGFVLPACKVSSAVFH